MLLAAYVRISGPSSLLSSCVSRHRTGPKSICSKDVALLLGSHLRMELLTSILSTDMRLFPPAEVVAEDDVVSVNGVGDTFLGIVLAGLAKNESRDWPHLIDVAQRGSVMTLKSNESVSPDISSLRSLL